MKRLLFLITLMFAAACSNPTTPLVGVSCSRYSDHVVLSNAYTDAVTAAGGVAVVLPTVSTKEEAQNVIKKLNGLLLTGGEDVNPAWYGEEVLNSTVVFDSIRDTSDSLLLAAALDAGKPVLAICRGSQLANVFLGGTLYQDIPAQLPENVGHGGTRHTIDIEDDSFLSRLSGTAPLEVNSTHHQCVKDLGKGVTVTARAADGIVEAWEAPGITAVQFHPEKLLSDDAVWVRFFRAWIEIL